MGTLQAGIETLSVEFGARVRYSDSICGRLCSATSYVVYGANAGNWDLPIDAPFPRGSEGQAADIGAQVPGAFGIVTTPVAGPPR